MFSRRLAQRKWSMLLDTIVRGRKANVNDQRLSFSTVTSTISGRNLNKLTAAIEAEKCLLCEDAPCSKACPAGTDPGKFMRQFRFDNALGAAETVLDNNPLGGICGQVCPVSQLCEGACTRRYVDGQPVKIGAVQKYLHEFGMQQGVENPPVPKEKTGHKAAIIGAGPAGLACARELVRKGSQVDVFDRKSEGGGALRFALSPYRVSHEMVNEEVQRIKDMGVKFHYDHNVSDLEMLKTTGSYDDVFVSSGLQASKSLANVDDGVGGFVSALSFLEHANNEQDISDCRQDKGGMKIASELVHGKCVTVIGGGSVAMDCAVTAMKLGATHVHILALEKLLDFPADIEEIELAKSLGVEMHAETSMASFSGDTSLVMTKTINDGVVTSGAVRSSCVIYAIGQELDEDSKNFTTVNHLQSEKDQDMSQVTSNIHRKVVSKVVDQTYRNESKEGSFTSSQHYSSNSQGNFHVFYGGDVVRSGGDTVVRAVADGKRAAEAMQPNIPLTPRETVSLETEFCGIKFENPFCLSSSPVTNTADLIAQAYDLGWGGSYFKTLNREDKFEIFHPSPRLNSVNSRYSSRSSGGGGFDIGIQNMEQISDRPLRDNLRDIEWLRKTYPTKITAVSIMGFDEGDWSYLAAAAEGAGAHLIELNFSCPQMARSDAGHHIGQQFSLIQKYTQAAKRACSIPVIAKMTPNITDMVPAALAAQEGGADGISAINTLKTISHINLDLQRDDPSFYSNSNASYYSSSDVDGLYLAEPNVQGHSSVSGFSGRAGRPIGLRFVSDLSRDERLKIPISGMGGIYTWKDGLEYILLGASNLQVTTSVMQHGAGIIDDMKDGLQRHLRFVSSMPSIPSASSTFSTNHSYSGRHSIGGESSGGGDGKRQVFQMKKVSDLVGLTARMCLVEPSELDASTEVVSVIDESKCIGCGACSTACRHGSVEAITLKTTNTSAIETVQNKHRSFIQNQPMRKAVVDPLKCIGCKLCDFVCPVDAISFTTRKRIQRE